MSTFAQFKEDEISSLSISKLKELIKEAKFDPSSCIEKSDLIELAKKIRLKQLSELGEVKELKDGELDKELETSGNKLVVVDFTAVWCPPCQAIAPLFKQLAKQYQDVVFLKVDVDKCRNTSSKYGISSMPTFHFYKEGKLVKNFSGADPKLLKSTIESLK
eukprot:gene4327-5417_t